MEDHLFLDIQTDIVKIGSFYDIDKTTGATFLRFLIVWIVTKSSQKNKSLSYFTFQNYVLIDIFCFILTQKTIKIVEKGIEDFWCMMLFYHKISMQFQKKQKWRWKFYNLILVCSLSDTTLYVAS
jgi:hypothetical protein